VTKGSGGKDTSRTDAWNQMEANALSRDCFRRGQSVGQTVFKQLTSAVDLGLLTTALIAASVALMICADLP
jgi:hypothetical protein